VIPGQETQPIPVIPKDLLPGVTTGA